MEKVIREELGEVRYKQLNIKRTSIGSASLGQAYQATILSDQASICLKVQYPGIDKAIDTDITFLKLILKTLNLGGIDFNPIFAEAKSMLMQELDYLQEAESTETFGLLLKNDNRYIVPKVIRDFSTKRIIATEFIEAEDLTTELIAELSASEKNDLARAALELFFREFFEWGIMQTDPHFGNYKVKKTKNQPNQLVLLDFGATRRFPPQFLKSYYRMFLGAYHQNVDEFTAGAIEIGLTKQDSPPEDQKMLFHLSQLILEPFRGNDVYHWSSSDLAQRVSLIARKYVFQRHFVLPPRELLFLDRKLGGVFFMLCKLDAHFVGSEILGPFLNRVKAAV
jgi:predicted unusual protein kinase regulating ubiquinone biosynthesis (AarF/ABC1/UbiB family)